MPISDWFKAREGRRYTVASADKSADLPDGVWLKCPSCKHTLYQGALNDNLSVCPHCGHHFDMPAYDRVLALADADTFEETEATISSLDPLRFSAAKPYSTSLSSAKEKTGLAEAMITGRALLGGHPVVLGAMDFRFIGASMGSAVGEKIARAFALAQAEDRALVLAIASGGARMQEGMLSLMQMAKTSAAAERLSRAGVPYISILTNPTYGGVTASFPVLADVILAEPGALIGFTGPRVIEQTIRQSLPKGFQTAEFLVEHGMIDGVVPRPELRDTVGRILDYLCVRDVPEAAAGAACAVPTEGGEE
ncbi:MAG: acetyl-CoA carboxylase carboxyl transferase subunit beta [Actinobacteria bacterium HGW-Actinobacteria-1]|jgi:acetyl-CoA carboxylase carboxyl transferase subunit beta|nr:MAG: acetyl-CoA carboxylase carboxyl transferase subunit beta [Actinobacteria bacterium HGW-Actinobacteria-1]